ncbi:MAG: metallophosphoesterase family protein [Polyangiales bacterium]
MSSLPPSDDATMTSEARQNGGAKRRTDANGTSQRIGVVGDVHTQWDDEDTRLLDAQGYDLVLITGDLGGYRARGAEEVARRMAHLRTPAIAIAGNHDAVHAAQLISEALPQARPLRSLLGVGQEARVNQLAQALGPIALGGYSLHPAGADLCVVVARPHSMGGPELAFANALRQRYGVRSLSDSAERLCACVDDAPPGARLIFLAHNACSGHGAGRADIAGRDFHRDEGDWGDPDLRAAVDHARSRGREVVAVVSGHMHLSLRGGGRRTDHVMEHGTLHLNAAEVPRHRRAERGGPVTERHHVRLEVGPSSGQVRFDHVWL